MGVLCLSLFWYALGYLLCVLSIFCNHLEEEAKAGCFAFTALRIRCYCKCFVALPHSAVNWYAVCDCGIS